jgi:hypothetical protein
LTSSSIPCAVNAQERTSSPHGRGPGMSVSSKAGLWQPVMLSNFV